MIIKRISIVNRIQSWTAAARLSYGPGALLTGAVLLAGLPLLAGCSRIYSAEISGYAKDGGTGLGVTGATVRIFLTQPTNADDAEFAAETTTTYNGQIPGYFDREIMWEAASPKFREEGDAISVWLSVTHPDFQSTIQQVDGILSGNQDVVPDILLTRVWFSAVTVTNPDSLTTAGINNATVSIDLTPSDSTTNRDFVTTTYTYVPSAGAPIPGTFTFLNVKWNNATPNSPGSDTHDVRIDVISTAGNKSATATLTSGQIPNVLNPIVVP
jgi:hypothetical protein